MAMPNCAAQCAVTFPIDTQGIHIEQQKWIDGLFKDHPELISKKDSLDFIWEFAVRFSMRDTLAADFADSLIIPTLRLAWLWRHLPYPRYDDVTNVKTNIRVAMDSIDSGIYQLIVLYNGKPIWNIARMVPGTIKNEYYGASKRDALVRLHKEEHPQFVFNPRCDQGLVEGTWHGYFDKGNCLQWYSGRFGSFTTSEITEGMWRWFMLFYYNEQGE